MRLNITRILLFLDYFYSFYSEIRRNSIYYKKYVFYFIVKNNIKTKL